MTLKEHLHQSIDRLDHHGLTMVYEQVSLLQRMQQKAVQPDSGMALERILAMTQPSTSNWGDCVREEREERG